MLFIVIGVIFIALNLNNFSFQQSEIKIYDPDDIVIEKVLDVEKDVNIYNDTESNAENKNIEETKIDDVKMENNENSVESNNQAVEQNQAKQKVEENYQSVPQVEQQVQPVQNEPKVEQQPENAPQVQEQTQSVPVVQTQPVQQQEQKPVEQKDPLADCAIGKHSISAGNSGKWFNSREEAVSEYNEKIKYYGSKWEKFEISDEEYKKNCPYGYEVYNCMYCGKWTINYYYR